MDPIVTGFGIIGQGGSWASRRRSHTQNIIQGGENIICSDVITYVLTNSGELTLKRDSFLFNPLKTETLLVASLDEPFLASDGNVRLASIIGASRPDQIRIIAQGMNEDILSRNNVRSTVRSDVGEADELDAAIQLSLSYEWNTASSRILDGSPEIIFRKVVKKSDSSERMKLAKSLSVHTPELVLLRHTPMQTDNVGKRRENSAATRLTDQYGIWRTMLSDIKAAVIYGESETISEKLAYRKFIKDSEFETREVFELENIKEREYIKNIETRLRMT